MRRPSIPQIAAHPDSQTFYLSFSSDDGIEVCECLRGVRVAAIAAVNDRDVRVTCHHLCRARPVVPHDNQVCVVRHHSCGIGEGFAFGSGGAARVCETKGAAAEAFHRALKREPRASAWLIKQRRQQLAAADACPCLQLRLHPGGEPKNAFNLKIRQIVKGYQMSHFLL